MQATNEAINFEASQLMAENVPVLSRTFDYRDVGTKAVPAAIELHPYDGPGGSAVPEATSSQDCITEAEAPITIRNAQLSRPKGSETGGGFVNYVDGPLATNCSTFGVVRDERVQFLVSSPTQPSKMKPFAGVSFKYNDLGTGSTGGPHTNTVNSPAGQDYNIYECTAGPKNTRAEVQVEEIPENSQTGQPLAKPTIFTSIIKHISPKPC